MQKITLRVAAIIAFEVSMSNRANW